MLCSIEHRFSTMSNDFTFACEVNLAPAIRELADYTSIGTNKSAPIESCAKVVKSKSSPVLMRPKKVQTTSSSKSDILQHNNSKASNIQLSRVKNLRDGGVLVGCRTPSETETFKKVAEQKLSEECVVRK